MRGPWNNREAVEREIDCHFGQDKNSTARIVRPLFPVVARAIWPNKTALHLEEFSGSSVRTVARWLSGEIDPPAGVYAKLWVKIIESRNPSG